MNPENSPIIYKDLLPEKVCSQLRGMNHLVKEKIITGKVDCTLTVNDYTPITIEDSIFKEDCHLSEISANVLTIKNSTFKILELACQSVNQIDIINCTIEKLIMNTGARNPAIKIISETVVSNHSRTNISTIEIKQGKSPITFDNIIFEKITLRTFNIGDSNSINLKINNCSPSAKKEGSLSSEIEIFGSVDIVSIHNSTIERFSIQASNHAKIEIKNTNINSKFCVDSKALSSVHIENSNTNSLEFKATNLQSLVIQNGVHGDVLLRVKSINMVNIFKDSPEKKLEVKTLNLSKVTLHNEMLISSCSVGNLVLDRFVNASQKVVFYETYFSESVSMVHCQLNKAEFNNIDFAESLRFTIKNSDLLQIKFHTVDWMHQHKLQEKPETTLKDDRQKLQHYLTIKESYRQLKEISIKALNKFDALNFQRNEQRMYQEILKLKGNTFDYLLLWTNGVFNDYGLSYGKPFRWLIGVHLFWFIILILLGDTFEYTIAFPWWSDGISGKHTLHAFGDFVTTLLPVHSTDYLNGVKGIPQVIDVFMRLTSGYFIYYFISATRKFHISN